MSGGGADSGGSSSGYPGWVGYIEFDDETGEAIAADYSGLEMPVTSKFKFNTHYKFRGDWNSNIPTLIDGTSMFANCSNLTSFTGDLSALTTCNEMFSNCTSLTSFKGDLSSLTNGQSMFNGCSKLTTFTSDLSSLTNGYWMFYRCSNLTTFTSDLSSLTKGNCMFDDCSNLTTFTSDLSSLSLGYGMFNGCSKLTTFTSDLSSLTNGTNMFYNCKLDKESFIRIITCLKERNTCTASASINIGVDKQFKNDPELLEVLGLSAWASKVTLVGHGGGTWTINLQAK